MNKAVLISIKPKWCELIASGKKTVEIRKTKPTAILPLKVYIYQTKEGKENPVETNDGGETFHILTLGKVIGEFVCHNIFSLSFYASEASFFDTEPPMDVPGTCLTDKEIVEYFGNGKTGFGWLISDLVIYDKPKELGEFRSWNTGVVFKDGYPMPTHEIKRPPQSFMYVEELQ